MAKQDPEGKRLARMRASSAADALELLSIVKKRCSSIDQAAVVERLEALILDLRRFQSAEAQRGGGHLEPRAKYKGRSQHLAVEGGRGLLTLYLDESGQAQKSPDQPVFVLAGVAMDEDQAASYVANADSLKIRFGLDPSITLHGPKIEKGVDSFAFGDDRQKQEAFQAGVADLVRAAEFTLVGAIIRKDALERDVANGEDYGNLPPGLYEMALTFVAERLVDMLYADANRPCGSLLFESIGNLEDALHQRAFADLLIHGSEFVSDGCFRGWLKPGCQFRTKAGSHPLELADLAARAMLTWTREGMPADHAFWALWASRIAMRDDLEKGRFGVKIFPDGDVRGQVMEMRRAAKRLRDEA